MSVQYFEGIGRRKQSIARVRIMAGSGRFIVNDKDAPAFFTRLGDLEAILAPMKAAGQDTENLRYHRGSEWWWCNWSDRLCAAWSGTCSGQDEPGERFSHAQGWFPDA